MADYDIVFEDNTVKVIASIKDAVDKFLLEAGAELEAQVTRNSRVDKGQTRGQWAAKLDKGNDQIVVGNPLENAIWEEFGTGEFAVNKDGRTTPWYVPVDGYLGTKKPTYNGKVVIVYGKNGKKFFKTNGKRGTRAFEKAKNTVQPKINKYAKEAFGKV